MGTDCHRNTFPALLADGERVDSYRRMMIWFSNHLLVRPIDGGGFDDRALKEALKAGRLYGVFEVLGFPVGFDYRAEAAGLVHEMGEEVALADHPVLIAARPRLRDPDPKAAAPLITTRILRATDHGFEELASSTTADVSFMPTAPGAYRAEVRITPHHLAAYLGGYTGTIDVRDFPWVYSNPIYVR
jgi:hypothetical protein